MGSKLEVMFDLFVDAVMDGGVDLGRARAHDLMSGKSGYRGVRLEFFS